MTWKFPIRPDDAVLPWISPRIFECKFSVNMGKARERPLGVRTRSPGGFTPATREHAELGLCLQCPRGLNTGYYGRRVSTDVSFTAHRMDVPSLSNPCRAPVGRTLAIQGRVSREEGSTGATHGHARLGLPVPCPLGYHLSYPRAD